VVSYWITELAPPPGSPSGSWSWATAVTMGGSAVGGYRTPDAGEEQGLAAAVQWTSAGTIVLGEPTPDGASALAVNDSSVIVGYAWSSPPTLPWLWHTYGADQDLFDVLGGFGGASGVNQNGLVTGWVGQAVDESDCHPFIYDSSGGGGVTVLDPLPGHTHAYGYDINDAGHVAGVSYTTGGEGRRLYFHRNGTPEDLGPGQGFALNSKDQVAGGMFFPGSSAPRACRVDASGSSPAVEDLGHSPLPGYTGSNGTGINEDGVVVGYSFSYEYGKPDRPFVHFPGGDSDAGFHDLEPLLLNGEGWVLSDAMDIGNYGSIVGHGTYQGQSRGYQLEPQTPSSHLDPKFEKVPDAILVFVQMFGGAERGGAGKGILPSGKPIPIPPHEWKQRWQEMSNAQRDLCIGFAIQALTEIVSDRERSHQLERTGQEIIDSARAELQRTMPDRR
jgi:uncharacterized membrane protein